MSKVVCQICNYSWDANRNHGLRSEPLMVHEYPMGYLIGAPLICNPCAKRISDDYIARQVDATRK